MAQLSEKNIINNAPIISSHYEALDVFPVSQITTQGNSDQNLLFELPSNSRCINPASVNLYFQFTVTSNNTTGAMRFYFTKTTHFIKRIYIYTKSGDTVADTSDCFVYSMATPHIARKSADDFGRYELYGDTDVASQTTVVANNNLILNSYQMDEVSQSCTANSATVVTFTRVLKLSDVYGGWFRTDKNVPLSEGVFIQLTIAPIDNWLYKSGNVNSSETAVLLPYVNNVPASLYTAINQANYVSPAYVGNPVTVTKCKLRFSQVADDILNAGIYSHVREKGLIIPYEFISNIEYTQAGQNQTISHRVVSGMGSKLRKIYYMVGPSHAPGTNQTIRFSANADLDSGNPGGVNINSVQFQLDGRSLITLDINGKDYSVIKYGLNDDIPGTYTADPAARLGSGFQYRLISNNFYLVYSFEDSDPMSNGNNYNAGVDTRVSDRIFNILTNLSANPTVNLIHYVFTVCTKYMVIGPNQIRIVSGV